jgi:hypothetical protein
MTKGNGFSEPTKAAIAMLQRQGLIRVSAEMCPWCKIRPASEYDHIEAKANGGNNFPTNGMFICYECNRRKSSWSIEDWMTYIKKKEHVRDIQLWLECKDKAEYNLRIGQKIRREIGFRVSEPPQFESALADEPVVIPRPNPRKPINPECYVQPCMGGDLIVPLW